MTISKQVPSQEMREKRKSHVSTSEERMYLVPRMLVRIENGCFWRMLVRISNALVFFADQPLFLCDTCKTVVTKILIIMLKCFLHLKRKTTDLSCSDPSVEYIADKEDCGRYFRWKYLSFTYQVINCHILHRIDYLLTTQVCRWRSLVLQLCAGYIVGHRYL